MGRSDSMPHVVFSGGQTGGHLFPGLAVAERLRTILPDCRITFCGSGCRFDRIQTHRSGFQYIGLPSAPTPKSFRSGWRFSSKNFRGLRAASEFVDREHVSLVVGLGGFSSVPMAWAAARRKLPLVLLEQNIVPGRATRWLASSADVVCLPWAQGRKHLPASIRVEITGNPVRAEFVAARRIPVAERKCRRVVIFGGSQGARQLNEEVPKALYKLRGLLAGWEIVHQTGEAARAATKRLYDNLQVPACVVPFVHHPAAVLRKTDLVVCRSGGTTLAELAVLGVPAVLVPYPNSAGDHQRHNAEFFATAGATVVVDPRDQRRRVAELLAEALQTPLDNGDHLALMRQSMTRLACVDAVNCVVETILALLRSDQVSRAA